ncbi:MAG: hypothetical protein IJR40_09915, partial [Treponema sp.]|nr:hypothetical protein [Treponema sp.]
LFALSFFSCDNSSGNPTVPPVSKKTSDWLFLFYLDADDDVLNDDIYKNIREIEYALSKMRKADGSPNGNYPSVNALVLWDGISEAKKNNQKYIHPDGALFELGADYNLDYVTYAGENKYQLGVVNLKGKSDLGDKFIVGANTIDWTAQARAEGCLDVEPNMADYKTLERFLIWAKGRYDATNVVLCLGDHGSGPYKETYADTTLVSKSLCSDKTNDDGKRLLSSKNIKDALYAAGYVGSQKPKILWNDVCFQSSAEILWNYKGSADYLLASPNLDVSQDFVRIMTSMGKGCSPVDFGKIVVSAYHERYYEEPQACPKSEADAKNKRSSGYSLFTFSFLSLDEQKAEKLKGAVDDFAAALLELKNGDAQRQALFQKVFDDYVDQDTNDYSKCKGLAYHGIYAFLSDLGDLALRIKNEASLSALHASADALLALLKHGDDNSIVCAWAGKKAGAETIPTWGNVSQKQLYLTGGRDYIYDQAVDVEKSEDVYGLTIASSAVYPNTDSDITEYYDNWLDFSSKWGEVIKAWKAYY